MKRVPISMPEALWKQVEAAAGARGISGAEVLRRAAVAYLAEPGPELRAPPAARRAAMVSTTRGRRSDLAAAADEPAPADAAEPADPVEGAGLFVRGRCRQHPNALPRSSDLTRCTWGCRLPWSVDTRSAGVQADEAEDR